LHFIDGICGRSFSAQKLFTGYYALKNWNPLGEPFQSIKRFVDTVYQLRLR